MEYPFNLLTEYCVRENNIDICEAYEIKTIKAKELLCANRFDLMAKWIYIDALEHNLDTEWAVSVYKESINAFSNGKYTEPGTAEKNSFDKYLETFNALILDIKRNGFDSNKSIIPVGRDDVLIDGAHRVAITAYFDMEVTIIRFPNLTREWDYKFFRRQLMGNVSMGYMAQTYARIKRNCYMACLWPVADLEKRDEVEALIQSVGNLVYSQEVYLTYEGIKNFMTQIYGHQAWTGNIDNQFSGVYGKLDACYKKNRPITTYLFEASNLEDVLEIKAKIRAIYNMENHSIHISDSGKETNEMAQLLYNRNSLNFLNRAKPYTYGNVYRTANKIKEAVEKGHLDTMRFIVVMDAVLEVCGIKETKKICMLTDYKLKNEPWEEDVECLMDKPSYYGIALQDMLYNPDNYFFFMGMKFATPQRTVEAKLKGCKAGDEDDIKLLQDFINKKCYIPYKYRFEIIDKINRYQIKNNLYGIETYSPQQYRTHRSITCLKKVKHYIFGGKDNAI